VAAVGLVGALALRRPELAVLASPFAVLLALGTRLPSDPGLTIDLVVGADRAIEGETVPVSLHVAARHDVDRLEILLDLPEGIEVAAGSRALALRLRAGEQRTHELAVRCTRWGVFTLGRVDARARDALRFLTWETTLERPHAIKAYPRPLTLRTLLSALETQAFAGSEVARVKGEGIEYADIRDFVPGDRVRSINWRASARRQGLVVNERHPERNTDVVLLVDSFADVRRGSHGVLENAVRATAALAARYLERRDRVGLVGLGGVLRWLQPGMGITQRYRLIETLIETGVEPTYAWRDVNLLPARVLPPKALVVALTPLVDPRFLTALEDLRGRRFDVAVVEIDPLPLVDVARSETEQLAYRLWRLERDVMRTRLAALGIGVATWGGADLDTVLEEVRTYRRYARLARA
jgi:uncharacterized protein (DUF58 family)